MAKEKLGLMDFVTLAKSGWTPETVNNVLDRMEKLPDEKETEGDKDIPEDSNDSSENEGSEGAESNNSSDSIIEALKKENETLKSDNETLKSDLAAAQAANRNADNSGKDSKTVDEMVDDIFKEFY